MSVVVITSYSIHYTKLYECSTHDTFNFVRMPIVMKVIIGLRIRIMLTLLASAYFKALATQV